MAPPPPVEDRYAAVRRLVDAEEAPDRSGVASTLQRVCTGVTRHLSVRGAAISLMSQDGSHGVAAASDQHTRAVDDLQFTTGVGPCHDAFTARRPVLMSDLGAGTDRWPGYTSGALDAGMRAVFAFPLHVGAVGFGVLDVYATRPGPLDGEQLGMALTFAQVATETLLDGDLTAPDGRLEASLETALDPRAEIHQAQGMLMVSLGVDAAEALARMRAYAFAHDRPLIDLAREVIAGRDHLEDE